jgi:hypothetical protein
MNMAQTNLSRRDSLKTARRFNAGIGLDGASSPGATAENARPFRPSLRDKIPVRQTNLSKLAFSAGGVRGGESQRDSGSKPKVARHALPWVAGTRMFSNPNGVVAIRRAHPPQPRWGKRNFDRRTQGSAGCATLGWRTQSRWDCQQNFPAARAVGVDYD